MQSQVERMEMDELSGTSGRNETADGGQQTGGTRSQASEEGGMLVKIRRAMESIREKLGGRRLFRRKEDGAVRIASKESRAEDGEKEVRVEEMIGNDGEEEVELKIEEEENKEQECENKSVGSGGTAKGFSFLDELEEEDKVDEVEGINRMGRKRKAAEMRKESFKIRGLSNTAGWKDRAKESREDARWHRLTEKEEGGKIECSREKIPLPEDFDLGLCLKGLEVNSSSRRNNNMGTNRKPLIQGKEGRKGEGQNWIASFTRAGCVGCKGEKGTSNHDGRTADPIVLVVGDEAIPSTVGYTRKGEGNGCSWVFKKEHLALGEVAGILRRLNEEKKEWDVKCGRRAHEFFIPNGSKIVVASYTHLRREGLEGYISDFNNMCKDVWAVTGDIGVEVLPCVPVVFEGVDRVGSELLAGVKNWIQWISGNSGKEAVAELSKTGGEETSWASTSRFIYRPSFICMSNKNRKEGEEQEWRNRGNRIDFVRGERKEVELKHVVPAKEIEKVLKAKGRRLEEEDEEEKERRNSFKKGVSVEAEYAFGKAISAYTRKAIQTGSYMGRQVGNIREQLAARAALEEKEQRKKLVLVIGGSQARRVAEKISEIGGEVATVGKVINIRGQWTREKVEQAKRELEDCETVPDCIVIGGPGSSIIRHGPTNRRGFGPEKRMVVVEGRREGSIRTEYHMTEPAKVSLLERGAVARLVESLVEYVVEILPLTQVWYLSPPPRHVKRCCGMVGHMQEEDVWVMECQRRELEADVSRRLQDKCEVVRWFEVKGMDMEPELAEIRCMGVVSPDGVHMTEEWCRCTAVNLCFRFGENAVMLVREEEGGSSRKRPKW